MKRGSFFYSSDKLITVIMTDLVNMGTNLFIVENKSSLFKENENKESINTSM